MANESTANKRVLTPPPPEDPAAPFGANEMRLNACQWLATLALVLLITLLIPRVWEKFERFDTGPDYRLSYALSEDCWLYARRLRQVSNPSHIVLLGDSVVWGEYVLPDGTLSHFLNREAGATNRFINGGVNGFFPLAMAGLVEHYGGALRQQKVIVQCNLLWMTSPKADLSTDKEEPFNHSRLVPQFFPRIPCYRADANERLSAILERNLDFLAWVGHLQNTYFEQQSLLKWTLAEDGGNPPRYANAWKNPLAQITLTVPAVPAVDPQRGPGSPRHQPWSGNAQGTTQFDWVDLDASLQGHAFQRVIGTLRARGNDVLVVLGPFNEHLMAAENRAAYRRLRDGISAWLAQNRIPHIVPATLPSALYADASHPLTEGYALLAKNLYTQERFQQWLAKP